MRKARWLAEWRKAAGKPVFYHVISRVVDRRFAFGPEEKEKFRALMRLLRASARLVGRMQERTVGLFAVCKSAAGATRARS